MRFVRTFAAAVVVLSVAGVVQGTLKQTKAYIGSLAAGDWTFFEKEGRPMLVQKRFAPHVTGARTLQEWNVSAPTIKAGSMRLTSDKTGTVWMSEEAETGPDWTFEIVHDFGPRSVGSKGHPLLRGERGQEFRVRVGSGPFLGWYLAAVNLSPEHEAMANKGPLFRPLTIVKGKEEATVFRFVEYKFDTIEGR